MNRSRTSLFCLAFLPLLVAQVLPPTIVAVIPNDPGTRQNLLDIHDLPNGFGWIDWLKLHPPVGGVEKVVAVIADGSVNCDGMPEIRQQCLPQFAQNFTDEPTYLDNNTHGAAVASAFISTVNNQMGAFGTAGYGDSIQFIPDKVLRSDDISRSSFLRGAYQHALDLRQNQHLNVRLVLTSAPTQGDSDTAESLRLIRLMAEQGIMLFAAAGNNGINLDEATVKFYPGSYEATEPNVRGVAGTDETGLKLDPASPFGPKTLRWAALGKNVQVFNVFDPTNMTTVSASGTSMSAPLAAGIYAATWAFRVHQIAKALRRVDRSCAGPVAGVSCGVPRLGEALKDVPVTLLAAPLESVTQRTGPFSNNSLFSLDQRNRIMLFLENVDEPLTASEVSITLEDSTNHIFVVIPEHMGEIRNHEWITQINVALPADISLGQLKITLLARESITTVITSLQ